MTVPNQFPATDPGPIRLACVGECPSIEENTYQRCSRGHGFALQYWEDKRLQTRDRCPVPECCSRDFTPCPTPFVGWSGRLLDDVLRDAGLPRERVFVGNVCQVMPPGGKLDSLQEALLWESGDLPAGMMQLRADLAVFRPNVVLCLGNTALRAFHRDSKASVTNWRGSLFSSTFLSTQGEVAQAVDGPAGSTPVPATPSGGAHSDNPPGKGLMGAVTACPPVSAVALTNNLTDATGPLPASPPPTGTTPPAGVASPLSLGSSDVGYGVGTGQQARSESANPPTREDTVSKTVSMIPTLSTDFVDGVDSTYVPLKCVAAFHPAAVLRSPDWTALLRKDVERAVSEAASPVLDLPVRRFLYPVGDSLVELTTTS